MAMPPAELKARLLAEAEAAIDQPLATRKPAPEASLADTEHVARDALPSVRTGDEGQGPPPAPGGDGDRREGGMGASLCAL